MRFLAGVVLSFVLVALGPAAGAAPPVSSKGPALAFRIDEGNNINSFVRAGPVAAHLLLRSGLRPRVLIAFPAGNSGIGLWFGDVAAPMSWKLVAAPRPVSASDARRRELRGIEFEIETRARELRTRAAVLSSIRVLRDFELQADAPTEVMVAPGLAGGRLAWARDRLDGAAGFKLVIEPRAGTRITSTRILAAPGAPLRLRIQAFTGETPLTPLPSLLGPGAGSDARARDALAFLTYQEKFLAGSWRFDTYFGRDTLMSALLLAPVLEPAAMESAIASVLDRLAPDGEVAHEEDIGEFAVLRNAREGRGRNAAPIYDYGMVDDDFMLAPLAARWLLDARGRARAGEFLASKNAEGVARGAALARNLVWVVERADEFADAPRAANLVGIKAGRATGNWRDSETGLGGGRFAYDVNAALVPAALDAAALLAGSRLLEPWLDENQRSTLERAGDRARVWAKNAPALFAVDIPAARARDAIAGYGKQVGVDTGSALRELGEAPLQFHALSLDERGGPVPILNTDEGFRLLLTEPAPDEIERCLVAILRPFPAGLVTGAGVVVANPALASADVQRGFDRNAYHGTVVWSWQQALLAAGIDRQLRRAGLPDATRALLTRARATIWAAIDSSQDLRTSELWSWSYSDGHYRIEPFGRSGADADESNAAQLWSTVFLGIGPKPPFGADPHP